LQTNSYRLDVTAFGPPWFPSCRHYQVAVTHTAWAFCRIYAYATTTPLLTRLSRFGLPRSTICGHRAVRVAVFHQTYSTTRRRTPERCVVCASVADITNVSCSPFERPLAASTRGLHALCRRGGGWRLYTVLLARLGFAHVPHLRSRVSPICARSASPAALFPSFVAWFPGRLPLLFSFALDAPFQNLAILRRCYTMVAVCALRASRHVANDSIAHHTTSPTFGFVCCTSYRLATHTPLERLPRTAPSVICGERSFTARTYRLRATFVSRVPPFIVAFYTTFTRRRSLRVCRFTFQTLLTLYVAFVCVCCDLHTLRCRLYIADASRYHICLLFWTVPAVCVLLPRR